jgi:integrase
MVSTKLQAASALSQNQGTAKVVAPLGCPQLFSYRPLQVDEPEFKVFPKTPKALRRELAEHGAHIHSLRHTYAYLLKTSGVHVTTAQKLMGHADPGVTLGIYTRFRDEEIDNAGAAIMDSLRGKSDYLMFTL